MDASLASHVRLTEVTLGNLRQVLALSVTPAQTAFVGGVRYSIAEAERSLDNRLLIDHRHQGRGFGTRVLDLCVDHVRQHPDARELLTSVVQEPGSPLPFYLRYGFEPTGEIADDELVLRLAL